MAKKDVVEIDCDRCDRVEYVPPSEYKNSSDLNLKFGATEDGVDVSIEFEDLCSSCKKTVSNLVSQITKKVNRKRAKEEEQEAKKEGASFLAPSPTTQDRRFR